VLLYYLLYRGLLAARSSQDKLGTYLSLLVVSWLAGQSAINIGMVLGLMPTIGVPLPFLSYGGTALIAVTCGVGLIANVRGRDSCLAWLESVGRNALMRTRDHTMARHGRNRA
jgi:cell division protein FtsW (lipid II flippase)